MEFRFKLTCISCSSSDYDMCLDDALLLYLEILLVPSVAAEGSTLDKTLLKASQVLDALFGHDRLRDKLVEILKKVTVP